MMETLQPEPPVLLFVRNRELKATDCIALASHGCMQSSNKRLEGSLLHLYTGRESSEPLQNGML